MKPLTSLTALNAAVAALPPIPPGKTRVFRGQTDDYETMRAAAYRKQILRSAIWQVYSHAVLMDITGKPFDGRNVNGRTLQIFDLWLEAVAQHYGAGSRYLDVTRSVEIAAWFALHRGTLATDRNWLGPPGPPSIEDLPGETQWLTYGPATKAGFLYAFDVDVWNGTDMTVPDLALVDLNRAPEPFRTPRMLCQEGCLIRVGTADEHDLRRSRVAGTPLEIAWPLTGSALVNRTVEEMFPGPAQDPWYRRFLRIPLTPEIEPASGIVLRRPLEVTVYRGETEAYNEAIADTETFLYPPLVHRKLVQKPVADEAADKEWWQAFKLSDATVVLLEAPLLGPLPPPDDNWNHELLLGDIADSVSWYTQSDEKWIPGGQTGLHNVFFQFSTLEQAFWERAGAPGSDRTLLRGVWIMREKTEIVAVLIRQKIPGTQVDGWPPVIIRLDPERRRLVAKPAHGPADWFELSELWELAKPVFVGLHLLRVLSPQLKPEAMSRLTTISGEGPKPERTYHVSAMTDAGRLVRVADPTGLADWHVMRDQEGAPYTQSRFVVGLFSISTTGSFADLGAAEIRTAMLSSLSTKQS